MRHPLTRRLLQATLMLALGHAATACAQTPAAPTPAITNTGQGQVGFASTAIGELSGITHLGGDSYFVVSDTNGKMAPATIIIDRSTGQITSHSIGTPITVANGNDLEGIAYDPRDGSVLISDEAGNTITRHLLADGSQIDSLAVPSIYSNARGNRGLESLSLSIADHQLWTANEEALTVDGDLSSQSQGTVVRLQRFDADGQFAEQFGYLTQPHAGDGILVNVPGQSGVSDLVALPGGGLIVMERELGGLPTYRNRLYLLETSPASDTTNTPALSPTSTGLADKQLLLQVDAGFTNFEGVTLGPMLTNGDYALLMVADDGAPNNPQNLLALRLSGIAIEGDVTGDFTVDHDDLAVVLGAWGDAVSAGDRLAGDLSGDGAVGVEDLDTVLAHWTLETPPPAVPEPGSAASLAVGALSLLAWRW